MPADTDTSACGLETLKALCVVRQDGQKMDSMGRNWADLRLQAGDKVTVSCAAHIIPVLRKISGLRAAAEAASEALPKGAKRRCLYEVTLSPTSTLVGLAPTNAERSKELVYTVLWSVRRSAIAYGSSLRLGSSKLKFGNSAKLATASAKNSDGAAPLQAGDTLLIEADDDWKEMHNRHTGYSLITVVPGSLPEELPAKTKPAWLISLQFYASVLSLVLMVVVSIMDWMTILPLSFFLSAGLLSIGCITPEQAWTAIKYRVVLTIMAAFGLGAALDNTDVADIIAAFLVQFGDATGPFPFLLLIFSVTALLSFLVGSTPAVILLYAAVRIANVDGLSIGQSMLALMLGAVCALATPVGFATNLMVQARAGYVFGDFFVLGSLVTMAVGLTSCSIILALPESMLPEEKNMTHPENSLSPARSRRLDEFMIPASHFDRGYANFELY